MGAKNLMEYKGYHGSYELSVEDSVFFGKLEFIKDLVSYEGETAENILESFHEAVDDYLVTCEENGKAPDKPFKGSFNVRVGEDLHRQIAMEAIKKDMSINNYIKDTLREKVS
jgi:predicted HicB family RNase H-like nuclease